MPTDPIHLVPNKFKSNMDALLLLLPALAFAILLTFLIAKFPRTLAGVSEQNVLGTEDQGWVR